MQAVQWTHSICVPLRMSMPVGQTATHWLQAMQSPRPARAVAPGTGRVAAGRAFSALVIVGDDDAILVKQRGLKPSVRADERAGLLAKPGEDQIEHTGEQDHDCQADSMIRRIVGDDLEQLLRADDVGEKRVCHDERHRKKIACLPNFLEILAAVQGALASARCWWASPSMAYSIFRKTISISTVCGQVQPHQSRP